MARTLRHSALSVFQNSRLVGRLDRAASGAIGFRYDGTWLDNPTAFPASLSLPLRQEPYSGAAVISVFENLLPDDRAIRQRIAGRVGAAGADAYSLLAAIGGDCVGALQFLPDGQEPGPAGGIEATEITDDEIAEILSTLASFPLGLGRENDFRISLAGAQEKTALLRLDGGWYRPHGTTATTHILKPRIGRLPNGMDLSDSVANEYLCLRLLAEFGLPVAQAEMMDFGQPVLVVERFDRAWTRDGRLVRLPQEDFCQALSVPPSVKYQSEGGPGIRDILDLLKGSDDPFGDVGKVLSAAVLFWLMGATDGHAKNFSIFLRPGGGFGLAPLYDVLTTQPDVDAGAIPANRFRMAMSVGKTRHYRVGDIMPRHFIQTAAAAGIGGSVVRSVFDAIVTRIDGALRETFAELPSGFPETLVVSLDRAVRQRGRLLEEPTA